MCLPFPAGSVAPGVFVVSDVFVLSGVFSVGFGLAVEDAGLQSVE